ncbi:MAG: hypothetical protein R2764_16335 [Bacteroidales bacterium]
MPRSLLLCGAGYTTTTGGIVYANGTVFRNNARALHAFKYNNYIPPNTTKYVDNLTILTIVFSSWTQIIWPIIPSGNILT